MKIYVSAMFDRHNRADVVARQLEKVGHEVTSRWHKESEWKQRDTRNPLCKAPPETVAGWDYAELLAADALLLLCEKGDEPGGTRGGRHWETGAAYALGKKVYTLWGPENVFHHLPGVVNYKSLFDFLSDYNEKESK